MPETVRKFKFTKLKIDGLNFTEKGQVIYWDTEIPGFGLTVGTRSKSFLLQIDVRDDSRAKGYRTIKKTLGRYGADLTLEQAKALVTGYVDKETGQAVIGERLKLKIDAPDPVQVKGKDKTLRQLIGDYYRLTKRRDGKERKPDTEKQYTKLVERHYSAWMEMLLPDIAAISPDVVLEKYRSNEIDFGSATTRNSSSVLNTILNYGRSAYPGALPLNPMDILLNPCVNIRAARKARTDALVFDAEKKRNDFAVFYKGISKCTSVVRDGFLFCLYTGMRRAEVEGLKWTNLDLEYKELLIRDTKNREDLHIPLNSQAMDVLERRKSVSRDEWVFPTPRSGGKNRTGHIRLFPATLKKITGFDTATTHGFRRTFTTVGRKLKRFEDADRLTNHKRKTVSDIHYDATTTEDLRETSQMIGDMIHRYCCEGTAKIIPTPVPQAV